MRFKCSSCDQWHSSIPAWGWRYPFPYHAVPEKERNERCYLTDDLCVIDDEQFLVTGILEISIVESSDSVSLQVWVAVNRRDWFEYQELIGESNRSSFGPYRGKLDSTIPTYPDTYHLPVSIEVRDKGLRPLVTILPSENPLYSEQKDGATVERVARLYRFFEHGDHDA